ncbi:MAG: IS110 family transposase [Microthrixaceae bacterium]
MGREYVGIDLHRRRSVIVRMDEAGETRSTVAIDNDPVALALEVAKAGPDAEAVVEATYGWYWAADVLEASGVRVRLAHPLGVAMFRHQRVKNDRRDATNLADLLRMGRLPESWLAPPATRELRELVRYRAKLVALRTGLKAQVHAVLAKEGVRVPVSDLFGVGGNRLLDDLELAPAYAARVRSLRQLIAAVDAEIPIFERELHGLLASHRGYQAVQAIHGVGRILAGLFVAEIGDVNRFAGPRQLVSWAGLTPKHRESDATVRRGRITKQGSKLVRWAAVEAVARQRGPTKIQRDLRRIADRRGKPIGRVAAARKLLTLVYYGLRDGEIRCLAA